MSTKVKEESLAVDKLEEILRSGISVDGIGKMRAINLIAQRADDRSTRTLLGVLGNQQELPRFRKLAAKGLLQAAKIGRFEVLEQAAEAADPASAATIARGFGRLAKPDKLPQLLRLAQISDEHTKPEAMFAATILAYRHGLDGFDVQGPSSQQLQSIGAQAAHDIEIAPAKPAETSRALEALAIELVDVDLVPENGLRIECPPNVFTLLWTSDANERGLDVAAKGKAVLCLLYRQSRFGDSPSLSAFGLGTAQENGVNLTLHRARTGEIMYAGVYRADGSLVVQASKHPGLSAVDIKLSLDGVRISSVDQARSASVAQAARLPSLDPTG